MQISFFEEFPTEENLDKLKLVNWPTKLYLAAKSLDEFNRLKWNLMNKKSKQSKYNNLKEIIYWPILTKKEGYWISPFSQRKALKRIFSEMSGLKVSVMLDLELPTTRNAWLYLTQALNFWRNKSLIRQFIEKHKGDVYLAEYYPEGRIKEKLMGLMGIHYRIRKVKIIKMLYHSLHNFKEQFVIRELERGKREFGKNFLIAYGTITSGIAGDEPKLNAKQLDKDLNIACNMGIKEVVIFRLGGLNQMYLPKIGDAIKRLKNIDNY